MAVRTFGWVQEAYKLENLKNVVSVFVPGSPVNRRLIEDKLVRLISDEDGKAEFTEELEADPVIVPYAHLKGKGHRRDIREVMHRVLASSRRCCPGREKSTRVTGRRIHFCAGRSASVF